MITLDDVIAAYLTARKNKRRSADQVEFELHWESGCVEIWQDIRNRCYQPTAYTFITDYPRPREVFASDMRTRVLHHYLDIRLRPLLEKRLSSHTYNNRKGMGQAACQNALIGDIWSVTDGFRKDAWIIKVDLKGCFPNIVQDIAYRQLLEVIENDYFGEDKEDLIYILNVCIYSNPTGHCYRKSPLWKWQLIPPEKSKFTKPDGIGAAIGFLIWQNAVNYYFHEIDEWLETEGVVFERFVDDFVFVTADKTLFLSTYMPQLRDRLAELGARLNENKFYCQHYTKGVEWLGVHIKMNRVYLNNRTVKRFKSTVRKLNRRPSAGKAQNAIASLNAYLGMLKNVNGYTIASQTAKEVCTEWRKYIRFDTRRACFNVMAEYSDRNRIINHYKLLNNEKDRNRSRHSGAAGRYQNQPGRVEVN